jgi:cytochrome c-type biogenesis protein CcmH
MKIDIRSGPLGRAALLLCLAASLLQAQEPPAPRSLSSETTSILGTPGEANAGLNADVVAVLGRPEEAGPGEAVVTARSADIASKLRCPVCQGVSIADSPSSMATKMRGQVRDLVAKGYSEEQVMRYFERSYGEFVRLEPPLRGLNVMLWVLPGLVLLGGAWFVFRKASQPVSTATGGVKPEASARAVEVDPELAKYLERIRRDSGTSS